VVVGKAIDDAYPRQLQSAAAALGVELVLTGRITDSAVRAAYACADVFALTGVDIPNKVEGFGLVLLEAGAQGLPAVVTRVHAIPEVVLDGQSGVICASNDTALLSRAFAQVLFSATQPFQRKTCVARARSFSWNRCAAETYLQW
jgi:glycosyltransferase involved in cell wall biosynthesis